MAARAASEWPFGSRQQNPVRPSTSTSMSSGIWSVSASASAVSPSRSMVRSDCTGATLQRSAISGCRARKAAMTLGSSDMAGGVEQPIRTSPARPCRKSAVIRRSPSNSPNSRSASG
ncbi:hypothetical protein CLG85_021130 [Yangia mangrovi]|uniref:Uncharacterized protein n=1 Tax=Alloyangia mangrovi TaxID=1779329 RepID=A0ABT2KRA5_9RHOB|nr:hypothetical protein [Alloyangia mangrovi]MCT4372671.1 hypothetical protein [Alloyangia mangrovi]